MIINHTVLVIAEPSFEKKCKDINIYKERLYSFLIKRNINRKLYIATLTGLYAYFPQPKIDMVRVETDDSNKTAFNKSVYMALSKFDEVVIISNEKHDPYIESIIPTLGDNSKGLTIYNYGVKDE